MNRTHRVRMLLVAGLGLGVAGCSVQPVQPWQRGDLALDDMQWEAGLVEEATIRDHTYTSKEAAALSPTLGGGGCGCN